MTNQIKIALVVIALAIIGFFVFRHNSAAPGSMATSTPDMTSTTTVPVTGDLKQQAWAVMQNYLVAAKAHDLKALTAVSYQVSDVCKDPKQQIECFKRMDSAYAMGTQFKQADLKNIISDKKQIILTSDYQLQEEAAGASYSRYIAYFTRDANGTPQVLYFYRAITNNLKTATSTPATVLSKLKKMIYDTDGDTIDDEVENCTYDNVDTANCVKTNPLKRDTDNDGWWDSTEALFYPEYTDAA